MSPLERAAVIQEVRERSNGSSSIGDNWTAVEDRRKLLAVVDELNMEAGAARDLLLRARSIMGYRPNDPLRSEIEALLARAGIHV